MSEVINILNKIKNSKFYEIDISMEAPFKIKDNVPFEVLINDGVAKFKVLASNELEAHNKVFDYLNSIDDDYDPAL
jgi:hypothetical protein